MKIKFKIYCDECDYVFDDTDKLCRMVNVGATHDTLCCPYCEDDSLKLIIDKEGRYLE